MSLLRSFKIRSGSRSRIATGPSLRKNREIKNSDDSVKPGQKPVNFLLLKRRRFDFFKKKNLPDQNLGLEPGRV
jgi:hypothetical protein